MFADTFYIYRDMDGATHCISYEDININAFFTTISRRYAFDDCSNETIIAIFWQGKEVQYVGWQPCMKYEYKDLDGNTVWVGYFPEWDH